MAKVEHTEAIAFVRNLIRQALEANADLYDKFRFANGIDTYLDTHSLRSPAMTAKVAEIQAIIKQALVKVGRDGAEYESDPAINKDLDDKARREVNVLFAEINQNIETWIPK